MNLPKAGAIVYSIFTAACCLAGPVSPETISEEARAFLKIAVPADLSQPETVDDWRSMRTEISQIYDSSATVQKRYPFKTKERLIGGVDNLVYEAITTTKFATEGVVLHIHGGAYVVGSAQIDSVIIAPLAHLTGLKIIAVNYRLAPEHPFPAALEDLVSVYRALLDEYQAVDIAVSGTSSGATLAVSLVLQAHTEGLPLPAALGLLSPWADIAKIGDSYYTLEGIAPVLDYEKTLQRAAQAYLAGADTKNPLISPVYADYSDDFTPTLIQTGTRDLFLSNCARLQRKMVADGVTVEMSLWEGMWHSFQMSPDLPEAHAALRELAEFLSTSLKQK
jgi:acetyl esterase/lipase